MKRPPQNQYIASASTDTDAQCDNTNWLDKCNADEPSRHFTSAKSLKENADADKNWWSKKKQFRQTMAREKDPQRQTGANRFSCRGRLVVGVRESTSRSKPLKHTAIKLTAQAGGGQGQGPENNSTQFNSRTHQGPHVALGCKEGRFKDKQQNRKSHSVTAFK